MPSLQFKGKSAVWNHHLSVPYHTLEEKTKQSLKGKHQDENLIIQGDNLLALKALLPQYQGKVKCIYIDPPYNTGNENWVYSDNVSSPTIKDWIGKAVGKEDLTRHDKWLAMMAPRLKMLRELLAEDGVIFISIDDNEQPHLKCLVDEIFGEENFLANLVWENKEGGGSSDSTHFKIKHEYVLCFAKHKDAATINGVDVEDEDRYTLADKWEKNRGKYQLVKLNSASIQYSASLDYSIKAPDGSDIYPSYNDKKACWRWSKKKLEWGLANDFIAIKKDRDQKWAVYTKQYFKVDNEGKVIQRTNRPMGVINKFSSTTATKELESLFGGRMFEYSKPYQLIEYLLKLSSEKDSIVLDSFAGSGTTAHAVLDLNKEDGGNRKFILVEMEDYADKITAERVRLASKKFEYDAGFTYYDLGPAIDAETLLAGTLPSYKEFAKYVYYLATGKNHPDEKKINETSSFVGKSDAGSVYLVYQKDMDALKKLAITLEWAQKAHAKDSGKKIVYAPACYLDDEALEQYNIRFVSIPYNLFERNA